MRWESDPVAPIVLSSALEGDPSHGLEPGRYWSRLRPHLNRFGISRVADITGLDRIGFPVMQAVRPWARSNAVTQGKAESPEGAAIGAVLECLEMAAGENLDRLPLVPSGDTGLWSDLAPGAKWPTDQTPFVAAWDLANDEPAAVPRDLICTNFSLGAAAEAAPILRHSIGLRAGATLGAALMHGLLECIEADARIRREFLGRADRFALDETHSAYGPLLCRLAELGMRVVVRNLSCNDSACVIHASIMEASGASSLPLPASGYAARACPHAAIAAALAEVVQARLAVISGVRGTLLRGYMRTATAGSNWKRNGRAMGLAQLNWPQKNPSRI
ncbi:YcaO-like family protein [Ruegeria sp. HKCCD8929]|uniref:YcaO-like family protein n=1 Tax=Ruegeria sp. HKCCD8929 TaxID=2683006 RepID=UPI0014896529|nr:YcaO-like family protein [Ruegeria sp. HKCCD8929]